ncbi:MAG: hypothetical protein LUE29_08155 [Lachnospiraceae bacterium]|nr:hypothetical protein [Lachnospiraceae bacterium]
MPATKDGGFILDDSGLNPYPYKSDVEKFRKQSEAQKRKDESKKRKRKHKEVKLEDTLGKLTPEQRKQFAAQFNTGLGSGMSPEEYQRYLKAIREGNEESDE